MIAMYGAMIGFFLNYFTEIDYMCEVIKNLFLEKETSKKFYDKYIVLDQQKQRCNKCCNMFSDFLATVDRTDS